MSRTTRRKIRAVLIVAVTAALFGGSMVGQPQPAMAAPGDTVVPPQDLAITFVARTCDDYSDIMANRARNNIQESLKDLGPDSTYETGTPLTPSSEDSGNPNCAPLPGWNFQLGRGIQDKSEGTQWLSTLSGAPFSDQIRTTAGQILELDSHGVDTGRTIEGATTVVLSGDAASWVRQGRQLWVQGGHPGEPAPARRRLRFRGAALLRRPSQRRQRRVCVIPDSPGKRRSSRLLLLLRSKPAA